jgi:hypothetical protein
MEAKIKIIDELILLNEEPEKNKERMDELMKEYEQLINR